MNVMLTLKARFVTVGFTLAIGSAAVFAGLCYRTNINGHLCRRAGDCVGTCTNWTCGDGSHATTGTFVKNNVYTDGLLEDQPSGVDNFINITNTLNNVAGYQVSMVNSNNCTTSTVDVILQGIKCPTTIASGNACSYTMRSLEQSSLFASK